MTNPPVPAREDQFAGALLRRSASSAPAALGQGWRRSRRVAQWKAIGLLLPALLLLLATFVIPIAVFLARSVDNRERAALLPETSVAIAGWSGDRLPADSVLAAFVRDVDAANRDQRLPFLIRNFSERDGLDRKLFQAAAKVAGSGSVAGGSMAEVLSAADPRFGTLAPWRYLQRETRAVTPKHFLTALDLRTAPDGTLTRVPDEERIFLAAFGRTLWISSVVTVLTLLLGFPTARYLTSLSPGYANIALLFVLLPFWTSLLVRTTAWTILLRPEGAANELLAALGVISTPLQLIYNRTGVYIAMTHVMLPFMILPIYSVMRVVPPEYARAASSLGATPLQRAVKVYLPLVMPGIAAGCLLVFVLAIGYYITPALVGGPADQMTSSFIAFYINETLNWSLAAALSLVLIVLALALYAVYALVLGIDNLRLG